MQNKKKRDLQLAFALLVLVCSGVAPRAIGAERILKTEANVMTEWPSTASRAYTDPFNEVTLDVVFEDPKGHEYRVPAFWDGANIWKARYASPFTGTHKFRSECSEKGDKGLHGIK